MQSTEIEVKFHNSETKEIRRKILALGGRTKGRVFETNVRYENRNKTLINRKALLRLRTTDKAILTFKSIQPQTDDDYKVMNEIEVEVSDAEKMNRILNALGFQREQVYEKWREAFVIDETEICLDSLPFGNFIEIEGCRENIESLARCLDLPWEKRIVDGYLAIFDALKTAKGLSFTDVTFDNFKDLAHSFDECIHQFEKHRNPSP